MPGHLDELKVLAADFVAGGEQVRGAADVSYAGKVNLQQTATGLAELGRSEVQIAAGEALVERYGDHTDVEFPTAKQMALVVTDTHLLVWSRGGLKGKPKAFLADLPLSFVRSVDHDRGRGRSRLAIRLTTGWEFHLDVVHQDGDDFGATLAAAVEGTAASGPAPAPAPAESEAAPEPPADATGDDGSGHGMQPF
jgi:hypothetical protein